MADSIPLCPRLYLKAIHYLGLLGGIMLLLMSGLLLVLLWGLLSLSRGETKT